MCTCIIIAIIIQYNKTNVYIVSDTLAITISYYIYLFVTIRTKTKVQYMFTKGHHTLGNIVA